jgi:hypothetical protein
MFFNRICITFASNLTFCTRWRNAFGTYAERPTKTVCYGDCEAPLWDLSSPVKLKKTNKKSNKIASQSPKFDLKIAFLQASKLASKM